MIASRWQPGGALSYQAGRQSEDRQGDPDAGEGHVMRRPEMLAEGEDGEQELAAGCQILEESQDRDLEPPGGMGEPEQRQGRHQHFALLSG